MASNKRLVADGWEWAIDYPKEKRSIYIKFESFKEGFKVGMLEKGIFKRVSYDSVRHLFEEDRTPLA
ncbi:hypothetical protein OAF54_02035 [bacterium]|nr:hypothetical protein [bacterium]